MTHLFFAWFKGQIEVPLRDAGDIPAQSMQACKENPVLIRSAGSLLLMLDITRQDRERPSTSCRHLVRATDPVTV